MSMLRPEAGLASNATTAEWQSALRASRQFFDLLHDATPDGVFVVDLHGVIVSANPACTEITGYARDELLQQPFAGLYAEPVASEELSILQTSITGEMHAYETVIRHKDGHSVELAVQTAPLLLEERCCGVVCIAKDLTSRKLTEELLLQSEKLSIAGQLAAGVAHEIRNPLTSLIGFVQLMRRDVGEAHTFTTYLDVMGSELNRIEMIVSELLVLAKPQATQFKAKSLPAVVQDVVTLLDTQAILHNIQIATDFAEGLPMMDCDEHQLKQVFINFLKNGIEAMPRGGQILIEVKRYDAERLLVRFVDQGCGIPKERIAKIGEPFYTTKAKGTGLGMMVSFKIIEQHRGTIQIESVVDVGTTIDVLLPIGGSGGNGGNAK